MSISGTTYLMSTSFRRTNASPIPKYRDALTVQNKSLCRMHYRYSNNSSCWIYKTFIQTFHTIMFCLSLFPLFHGLHWSNLSHNQNILHSKLLIASVFVPGAKFQHSDFLYFPHTPETRLGADLLALPFQGGLDIQGLKLDSFVHRHRNSDFFDRCKYVEKVIKLKLWSGQLSKRTHNLRITPNNAQFLSDWENHQSTMR